jgi:glycine cleavage system H protein
VSDVYSPLTGKVLKVNSPLSDTPEYLNDEPYDDGWMVQIEIANPAEVEQLMTAAQYEQYLKEQG